MKRLPHRIVASVMLIAVGTGTAGAQATDQSSSCAQQLESGLQKLIDLPASQWRFVVLDEPQSGHFIQYAWWGGVTVDLPLAALDAEQQARAAQEFERFGAGTPILERGPDGSESESTKTFQHDFGRDTAAAARFGCEALRRVYLIDASLLLQVNIGGD